MIREYPPRYKLWEFIQGLSQEEVEREVLPLLPHPLNPKKRTHKNY